MVTFQHVFLYNLYVDLKCFCIKSENLYSVYGALIENTVCKWFARFRRNFDLKDLEHSGRSAVIDNEQIEMWIKNILGHMTTSHRDKILI